MKKLLTATAVATLYAGTVSAADVSALVELDFTQNADDKIVAAPSFELNLGDEIGSGSITLVENNGNFELDMWSVGTWVTPSIGVALGDQGDLFDRFEGTTEVVGGTTLADLDDDGESVAVVVGDAAVMVGLTDITTDVTDVKNIQGTYAIDFSGFDIAAGADYNMDSEELTYLGAAGYTLEMAGTSMGIDTTVTYSNDVLGYETAVNAYGVDLFVNGDQDEMAQNIGAGYSMSYNEMDFYAEAGYNLDREEITPAAGVSFSF